MQPSMQAYYEHMRATPSSYMDPFNLGSHGPFDGTGFPKSPEESAGWPGNPMAAAAAAAFYQFPPSGGAAMPGYERMMTPSFGTFGAFPPTAAAAAHPHNPFQQKVQPPWGADQHGADQHGNAGHAPTPTQGGQGGGNGGNGMRVEAMV